MKHNIFLDLDNTIICSEPLDTLDVKMHKNKITKFNFHNMDNYYIVFERPNLQEFLNYLFKNFNVSIWTAASKSYALFIIDKIIKPSSDRKIDYLLFSYHCDWSEKTNNIHKGLKLLWNNIPGYTKDNTIIIDDLKEVYQDQPKNAINIKPFEFLKSNSENDTELLNIQKKLKNI